ncbi:Putative monooxygenase [Streptomyces sp. enrichment culture]|uniref:putative quinol monooxygenase n=1 Tax=Streptomyces sp. enrichment culture TaxID=1795815 RepID=UPI003F56B5DD
MEPVIVVGTLRLRPDTAEEARTVIASVVEQTHQEPGCLLYAAHEDAHDPLTLVVVEQWASQQALDEHNRSPYLASAMGRVGELLAGAPDVRILAPLGYGAAGKATLNQAAFAG